MSDHADHHHAAPAKPNATTTMGIALFIGMVTVIVALVGAVRGSDTILTIGLITGIVLYFLRPRGRAESRNYGQSSRSA